jgi:hypothetical protein
MLKMISKLDVQYRVAQKNGQAYFHYPEPKTIPIPMDGDSF